MTARGRWLVLAGLIGWGLGLQREQSGVAHLSVAVLVWCLVEWLQIVWLEWYELPRLGFRRTVNGSANPSGILWCGRSVQVHVSISGRTAYTGAVLTVRDVLPDVVELVRRRPVARLSDGDENSCQVRGNSRSGTLEYCVRPRASGVAVFPGFRVVLESPYGLFRRERFTPVTQHFRILPGLTLAAETVPHVKRTNYLPQHGIHRWQRSGLGSELIELREYISGDPPKSIAWKASARRGILMTRKYDSGVPVRVQLFLDGSVSARLGGFGQRLLDQMTTIAAGVARSAISVGDPVGLVLLDEQGVKRCPAASGERGFQRHMEAMADFIAHPPSYPLRWSPRLHEAVMRVCSEHFPELGDSRCAQPPFTVFPIIPWRRRFFRERYAISVILGTLFDLPPTEQVQLLFDDSLAAKHAFRLFALCGHAMQDYADMEKALHAAAQIKFKQLSDALINAVAHARDNEVFVVLVDLLSAHTSVENLVAAIKTAHARFHRIVVVCPSPSFVRPSQQSTTPRDDSATALLVAAEQLVIRQRALNCQRVLRQVGANITFSGEIQAIQNVLSEIEVARSGRTPAKQLGYRK